MPIQALTRNNSPKFTAISEPYTAWNKSTQKKRKTKVDGWNGNDVETKADKQLVGIVKIVLPTGGTFFAYSTERTINRNFLFLIKSKIVKIE